MMSFAANHPQLRTRKSNLFRVFFVIFATFFIHAPLRSITVDLREPTFSEGVLRTEKGGVIVAPNIRIQAKKILYTKKEENGSFLTFLEAEEDLIVEFGDYIFVGKRLEYDFEEQKGIVYEGRTAIEPWFFGGKEIHLLPDGSYKIYQGFATTSENYKSEWCIQTEEAILEDNRFLTARNVHFRLYNIPLLWIPKFRINLNSIFDSPFGYTFAFGGPQGPRLGVSYDAFEWRGLKTRLIVDYRLKRGLGGGVEFDYKSPTNWGRFHSINYMAKDLTLYNDKVRTRYRFLGDYTNTSYSGKTTMNASYDILSDKEMATDYSDRGLQLETADRTQIEFRRQEEFCILNLLTRFRVNSFQTVKQELPTFSGCFKPFVLGKSGIISDNRFEFSYLELDFTDDRPDEHNFNSPRYELCHQLYRPLNWQFLSITPQAGFAAIYYGNNPKHLQRWMTIGLFEINANTNLYKFYDHYKHVITPYICYQYYTFPTTPPNELYIFDIDDGWYRLNMLTLGINNCLYTKTPDGYIYRKLFTDLFAYGFFDTETLPRQVPKIYGTVIYNTTPYLRHSLFSAWDIQRNMLDHLIYRIEWTLSPSTAVFAEYRRRSPYDWRKADHTNFILDSYKHASELRHSQVSDRRDTLLLNFYHQFHLNWALALQSRSGWNRIHEKNYREYEIDLLGTFRSAWHLKLSYQHREDEDRFICNFSIGLRKPEPADTKCLIPNIEF